MIASIGAQIDALRDENSGLRCRVGELLTENTALVEELSRTRWLLTECRKERDEYRHRAEEP